MPSQRCQAHAGFRPSTGHRSGIVHRHSARSVLRDCGGMRRCSPMSAGTRYCLGPDVPAGETESSFRQPRARAPRLLAAGRPAVFFVETPPARAAVDRPMAPSRHLGTAHISTLVYSLLGERRLSNPGRCQASSSNGRRPVNVAGGMRAQRHGTESADGTWLQSRAPTTEPRAWH